MAAGAPLTLEDFGSFHLGGRRVEVRGQAVRSLYVTPEIPAFDFDPNGDFIVEQAYVQYFVPAARVTDVPVVLQHGGGMTGAAWETTPDGRPGWLHRFLEAGFPVYVIDNVERGRAGWCVLAGEWPGAPLGRSLQEAWSLFRFGRPEDFAARQPFDEMRFPLDHLEALARSFVPRWLTTTVAQVAALSELVARVGPAVLIGHSQGGDLAQAVTAAVPAEVQAMVAVEPSGLPDAMLALDASGPPVLYLMGDNLDASPLWSRLGPASAARVEELRERGLDAEYLALPARGIHGNSHAPMMDDNSDEIAKLVQDWILARL